MSEQPAGWLADRDRVNERDVWVNVWLTEQETNCMFDLVSERVADRFNDPLSELVTDWLNECQRYWRSVRESELHYNWQSVSQYVLVSSPIWDFWPEIFFF
jgi:hypothetical protein